MTSKPNAYGTHKSNYRFYKYFHFNEYPANPADSDINKKKIYLCGSYLRNYRMILPFGTIALHSTLGFSVDRQGDFNDDICILYLTKLGADGYINKYLTFISYAELVYMVKENPVNKWGSCKFYVNYSVSDQPFWWLFDQPEVFVISEYEVV